MLKQIVDRISAEINRTVQVNSLEASINELKGRLDAYSAGMPLLSRSGVQGNQFVASAKASIGDRGAYEQNFKIAFAPQPTAQKPAKDNPSNAQTVMKDGKAVYSDDNYTITASEKDSEVVIYNKKTKETYRAFGDPHMEVDGKQAFDFYGKTSFKLAGGPKVTLDTVDGPNGTTFSSKLTITNGGYGAQIIGIDDLTKGDLAVKEFRNQGRELDRLVDDGVVLEENQDMTINDGRGFIVTDVNGSSKKVDQPYINGVDLLKTKGQKSQGVNRFDTLPSNSSRPDQMPYGGASLNDRPDFDAGCHRPEWRNSASQGHARSDRSDRSDRSGADQFSALRSLMGGWNPSWNDCFGPPKSASADRQRQRQRDDDCQQAEPPKTQNRVKVKVNMPDWMNANVNIAMNSGSSANVRLQVWG